MITSKDIYSIVSDHFEMDITKTRKRVFVYVRSIANVLSKKYTKESLEKIGRNYNGDHATVLHSINEFQNTYKLQKEPFNVYLEYQLLDNYLNELINNIKEDETTLDYKTLFNNYNELSIKYNLLKQLNENLNDEITKLRLQKTVETRYKILLNEVKDFNDKEVDEFIKTRLKPFKLSLSSRPKGLQKAS